MKKLEPFSITLTTIRNSYQIEVPLHKICLIHALSEGCFIWVSEQKDGIHVKETIEEIKKLCQPTIFFKGEQLC